MGIDNDKIDIHMCQGPYHLCNMIPGGGNGKEIKVQISAILDFYRAWFGE